MKSKTACAFTAVLVLIAFVFSLHFVAAETSTIFSVSNVANAPSVLETAGTYTFTFDLTYTGTLASKDFDLSGSTTTIGTLSFSSTAGLVPNETRTVTGTLSNFANQGGNTATVNLIATSGAERDDTQSFTVQIIDSTPVGESQCQFGEVGTLRISDFNINNNGKGSDDEWEPLDEIEIEVEVENTDSDDDVSDVMVEIIIREGDNDVTNDFDIDDEEIDLGKIRDDDEETATFRIDEVPADIDEGDYQIFIKAYSDGDEDEHCVSESRDFDNPQGSNFFHEIEYVREDDPAVIVKDDDLLAANVLATCGDKNVQVSFPIYNVGTDKEDKVLVDLTSRELGIDMQETVDDLRSGKRKEVTFFFDIPEDLARTRYDLDIVTYFEYDDDEEEFDTASYDSNSDDDLDENYEIRVEILSCSVAEPSVTAELDSEAMLGEELVISSSVTNNGDREAEFLISVTDFNSWAELIGEEIRTVTLGAGETETLELTFVPTEAGLQTFTINAITDGTTYDQAVSVNIADEETVFGGVSDTALYLIIAIVLVLILIFLTLIIKAARRGKRTKFSDIE